jgi:hypothetical protein
MYYLAYPSKASGSSVNNRVLVFDLLSNAYSVDLLSLNAFCTFNAGSDWDVLYSGSSSSGKVYAHTLAPNEIVSKTHSDFTGTFTNARYLPTRWGGDTDSPVIEISRTATVNGLSGTINNLVGTIDRAATTGDYLSPVFNIPIYSLDKAYWNERFPSASGDVIFTIRAASSEAGITTIPWSSEYTNPSGSDISGYTADATTPYLQYYLSLTTGNVLDTPIVYKANGYVVKILYNAQGSAGETTIPLHWISGWSNFGYPLNDKLLRKINVYYESESAGTLALKFENYEGESDTFSIDLSKYQNFYEEYFTDGALRGRRFKLDVSESSLKKLRIKEIDLIFDLEPAV